MSGTPTPAEMETAFSHFATRASGTEATSKDVTRWFTDSGVLSKKPHMTCNSHTLDVCFTVVKEKGGNTMSFMDIDKLIIQVAKTYKADNNLATDEEATTEMGDLAEAFKSFATKANNTEATTKDLSRWFTDTGAFTKKSCNSNNLDICFSKVKTKGKKCVQTHTWLGHKERFDAEGKGKGMSGREDIHANTGYVGNYKGAGTYDGK
ncbi:hypothetical protein NP493_5g08022 [Ridgeia piscesae]|uniref:Uncharacterized protein n=1 Tax=Ridgeia piscesae TaxID=27915 RepID=A0AAD9PFW6_RIDPI|nr:hypothetical protein NP493_5g08022 [Ridgeia piscesae]